MSLAALRRVTPRIRPLVLSYVGSGATLSDAERSLCDESARLMEEQTLELRSQRIDDPVPLVDIAKMKEAASRHRSMEAGATDSPAWRLGDPASECSVVLLQGAAGCWEVYIDAISYTDWRRVPVDQGKSFDERSAIDAGQRTLSLMLFGPHC
ncbi:MAG: hypothetical protein RIM72_00025 [Alphaproteobacteria bacterium]|jgi:hypothetical protein